MFEIEFTSEGAVALKGRLDAAQAVKAQSFLDQAEGRSRNTPGRPIHENGSESAGYAPGDECHSMNPKFLHSAHHLVYLFVGRGVGIQPRFWIGHGGAQHSHQRFIAQ